MKYRLFLLVFFITISTRVFSDRTIEIISYGPDNPEKKRVVKVRTSFKSKPVAGNPNLFGMQNIETFVQIDEEPRRDPLIVSYNEIGDISEDQEGASAAQEAVNRRSLQLIRVPLSPKDR